MVKRYTRRNAIKLAGGLITTGAATGVVAADDGDGLWNYTYETDTFQDSDGFVREVETLDGGVDIQAFNFAVNSHVAQQDETEVNDYRIIVELLANGITLSPSSGNGRGIQTVHGQVTHSNDNAFDFREDEDWMGLWHPDVTDDNKINYADGEDVSYADYGRAFVEWGLEEIESYITDRNLVYSGLSSAAELIANMAGVGKPSDETFEVQFLDNPRDEIHAYRRFEITLDPQQEVSFEVMMEQSPKVVPGWGEFGQEKQPVFEGEYTISAPPLDPYPTIGR